MRGIGRDAGQENATRFNVDEVEEEMKDTQGHCLYYFYIYPSQEYEDRLGELLEFRKNGFEAATMRGIAASAGIALGGAYYYFDSKDAIL